MEANLIKMAINPVSCGSCKGKHLSAAAVRLCYSAMRDGRWFPPMAIGHVTCWMDGVESPDDQARCMDNRAIESAGELEAERLAERWYEEGF